MLLEFVRCFDFCFNRQRLPFRMLRKTLRGVPLPNGKK